MQVSNIRWISTTSKYTSLTERTDSSVSAAKEKFLAVRSEFLVLKAMAPARLRPSDVVTLTKCADSSVHEAKEKFLVVTSEILALKAKAPARMRPLNFVRLSKLVSRILAGCNTRSSAALVAMDRLQIDAAASALSKLGGNPSQLSSYKTELEARAAKAGEWPAQLADKRSNRKLRKDLIASIATRVKMVLEQVSAREARKIAEAELKSALRDILNAKPWNSITTDFRHRKQSYACTLVPAAQMKRGEKDIFPVSYEGKGVSSMTTSETTHTTNMWTSEIRARDENGEEKVLFKGVRHGVLSPFALQANSIERKNGALAKGREVVTAALFARPELLDKALQGEVVPLKLVSTSLLTCGMGYEGSMLRDQIGAWQALSREQPLSLEIVDEKGDTRTVRVALDVAAFNFGVNEFALLARMGHKTSERHSEPALRKLLGDDLARNAAPGGWVGEFLKHCTDQTKAQRVQELVAQIKDIWLSKAYRTDNGEPYKAPQRLAMLAYEIGAVPCWNCKSGKDRTGMLDAEIKREAVKLHQEGEFSKPGQPLSQSEQSLFQNVLLNGGNIEVQTYNTGVPGSKVLKSLPQFLSLSYKKRIGDAQVWKQGQGLSKNAG